MIDTEKIKETLGKPRVELVSRALIENAASALEFGIKEGKPEKSYMKLGEYRPFLAAMMRHILKILDEEGIDEKSGLSHIAHIAANASIICEMNARGLPLIRKEKK